MANRAHRATAKSRRRPARRRTTRRSTNWRVIGGVMALGLIALLALLGLALRAPASTDLADYCAANPARCVDKGAADAPITVVEVSDFGCPHCQDFQAGTAPLLATQYIDPGQVRWLTLPYALSPQTAPLAAAALCAADQGAYDRYAAALYATTAQAGPLPAAALSDLADTLGLDGPALGQCLADGRHDATLTANIRAAERAGVRGTPTFFVNGRRLAGGRALDDFARAFAPWLGE